MKKITILAILSVCYSASSIAQDLDAFLEGGAEHGNKLMQDYMEPAFVGLGYALNSGWYNTGKPHKLLGFDLTLNVNAAYVPQSAQFFTFRPGDYNNEIGLEPSLSGSSSDQLPTIFGPNKDADDIPFLVFNQNTPDNVRVTSPTGLGLKEKLGFNAVPAPSLQLGLGLVKNTELKLRLLPEQTFGDSGEEISTKMFGLGVMHDVKQWIPGIKNLPFDLSGFFAFNTMSTTMNLDAENPDQMIELKTSGTTLQGIISKKIAVLTVYGGLGYISGSTSFKMLGEYDISAEEEPLKNPIAFDYSGTSLRANLGARLKLAVFTLHAEYAVQKYNTLTAGFGISVR